jgi:hypothetical protein
MLLLSRRSRSSSTLSAIVGSKSEGCKIGDFRTWRGHEFRALWWSFAIIVIDRWVSSNSPKMSTREPIVYTYIQIQLVYGHSSGISRPQMSQVARLLGPLCVSPYAAAVVCTHSYASIVSVVCTLRFRALDTARPACPGDPTRGRP